MLTCAIPTPSGALGAPGNVPRAIVPPRRTNNSSNQLTVQGGATYTWDNNGNLATRAGNFTSTYTFDFENRMVALTQPGTPSSVSFKYDPFGRRIYKSSSVGTSIHVYDGDNQIEEVDASGSAVARYTQGLGIDEPLVMQRGATPSYFEADGADGLGTITSLTNPSGNVTQSYAFDSFGVRTSGAPTVTNSFQYTARELDSETGWYYYRARYYAPLLGRFISEDPIQFRGDVDFYPYVGNNPALRIDPRGLIHQAWNEPPFDGRLHDDPGAGSEVLCTKGRNIQRDIEWLEHSITVRQAEIFKLGREADLGHLDRLEAEIATLDRCYDKCDKDTKPVPVPAPAPARSRRRVPSTLPNVPAPSPATQTGLYGTVLLILTLLLVFAAA